ncbi:MAG TPA: uroporphyrinogen-III synthase [Alphaproteobacteria bacterium]|nr:uroporphyrinogen-III synthase [Alphaproteobacteria bacterium]
MAAALGARGIDCIVEPLLTIRQLATPALPLEGVQALLFTSANGVRAFAAREEHRSHPVFAVGERTAEVARSCGFAEVAAAQGTVEDLAALVRSRLDPQRGALFHGAGAVRKGDLAALLAPAGFELRRVVLYEAVPAEALSSPTIAAIEARRLDAVLLFSPRTARTFVSLAGAAGIAGRCAQLAALCLSPAVGEAARGLPWRDIRIAARPEQGALLELLGDQQGQRNGERPVTQERDSAEISRDEPDSRPGPNDVDGPKPANQLQAAEPAAARRSRGPATAALWATTVAGLVLAAALSLSYWGPPLGLHPGDTAGDEAARNARLTALEGRVQALAGQNGGALAAAQKALVDRLAADEKRQAALERSFAELAARPAGNGEADAAQLKALSDQVAALKGENATLAQQAIALGQRLAALESQAQQNREADSHRAAFMLAVGQLEQALTRSAPYDQPLAAVAALGRDDKDIAEALAALKPRAATGVPTVEELAIRFDGVSVAAAQAVLEPAQPGWMGKVLSKLSRLVVIRRTDSADAGDSPGAVLARAETLVHKGDLAAAANLLGSLKGAPAKAVAPWLADARARLAADDALKTLAARAIARLGEARS